MQTFPFLTLVRVNIAYLWYASIKLPARPLLRRLRLISTWLRLWLKCRFRSPLCPPNYALVPVRFLVKEISRQELNQRLERTRHGQEATTQETRTEADAGEEVLI